MKVNNLLSGMIIGSLTLAVAGCGSEHKTNNNLLPVPVKPFDYQALLNTAAEGEIPGVVLYIESPQLYFYGAAGMADLNDKTPMPIDARIPNGSAGKKLTALLAAMLVEQQKLNLDQSITNYLPAEITNRVANASSMTTRQMLQHTAGLFDYLNDSNGAFYDAVVAEPDSIKTDAFALQFALDQKAKFAPAQGWSYSNTGYILTGLVLDQVLGTHHSQAMRKQIFEPLGLSSLSYGGLEKSYGPIVPGYFHTGNAVLDTRQYYQNIGVADAPVVGNAKDMANILKFIVEGKQFSHSIHQLLMSETSFVNTGLGTMSYSYGLFKETINGKQVIHHGGQELGYATYNFYIPDTKTTVAMLVNCNGYQACNDAHNALYQKVISELTQ